MPAPSSGQPVDSGPESSWEHIALWQAVKAALYALPSRFESDLVISGVLAPDLFSFNSSLGATIEEQVVASMNKLRAAWDPANKYALYQFERQPQIFPDVILNAQAPDIQPAILMGIELKGWYALAKEGEPSYRYKVSANVCAPADLLVVVPWALSRAVSGSPKVFTPFVVGARYAAEMRNWYWKNRTDANTDIVLSSVTTHYPTKGEQISDKPADDGGGNFGRVARTKIMKSYIKELMKERLLGIPLAEWQGFLERF